MTLPHLRSVMLLFLVVVSIKAPVTAAEAGKLLPADTEIILTLNCRQLLDDHKNVEIVQRYLEQWRLALAGDEKQLKKYYKARGLLKLEGITEEEFLNRAKMFKSLRDAVGMDPLQDIDRITVGFKRGNAGFWIAIIEGRFREGKFSRFLKLNDKTLAGTSSQKAMDDVLALAAGKKKEGLSPTTRTLLEKNDKQHVMFAVNNVDVLLKDGVKIVKEEIGRLLGPNDTAARLIVDQVTGWLQKNGNDFSAACIGLSIGDDELKLQWSVETKKPEMARELHSLVNRGNILASVALAAIDNELSRQLAGIILRQHVAVTDTTLVVQTQVLYAFIEQVVSQSWQTAHPFLDEVGRRVTSLPLWGPLPVPPGALEVEEVRDIAYRDDVKSASFRQQLDLFVPKGKKDFPVVVLVHGGAWMLGDNRCCGLYSTVGRFLASQGIGAVLPNYRLTPGVKHPVHIQDVARAVAWTHRNIARYGGSPERLFLLGHSAGGHLVSLLATDESYLKAEGLTTADIKGVITASGVYRIPAGSMEFTLGGSGTRALRLDEGYPVRGASIPLHSALLSFPARLNIFGPVFGDDPKERDKASPLTHVRRGLPPFLILTAEHDLPTLPEMATEFHQALLRAGCAARLVKVEKRNHNSLMFRAIGPEDAVGRVMLEFVRLRSGRR